MQKIGYRNIKTAISVFICIIIYSIFNSDNFTYACISTILCVGNTLKDTLISGKHRIIGTLIGGGFSIIIILIIQKYIHISYKNPILIAIGVSSVIYLCNVFKSQEACGLGCVTFLIVMLTYSNQNAIKYITLRMLDTIVGILVASIVNVTIKPYKKIE